MPGHKLVVSNVDQEIVLEKALNLGEILDAGEGLARRGGEGHVGDHYARLVVVGDGVLCKGADLADTELLVLQELDPDGTAVGDGVWVGRSGRGVCLRIMESLGRAENWSFARL